MSTIETIEAGFAGRYPTERDGRSRLAVFWTRFLGFRQLRRTRLHLIELTDDQLRDIGITREAAEREALRSTLVHYLQNAR